MPDTSYKINQPIDATYKRRYRRRTRTLAFMFFVICVVAAVAGYEFFGVQHAGYKSGVGANFEQNIAGPQGYKSSYFEFTDSSKWVYAPNDSTANKLTYLLYQAGVPAHSLTVYVNKLPSQDELAVNHVLPVNLVSDHSFSVGSISDSCSTLYKPTDRKVIKPVAMSGTSFLCVPDSGQYLVVVGKVGADYNLTLKRADGETAQYVIVYHNLSINPDPAPFIRIMKTFKAL